MFEAEQEHKSIWHQGVELPRRAALECELRADVAVIGGGMAGMLIADRLRGLGLRAVVLEARRIGSGQSGNTTAKITSQHGLLCTKLCRDFGPERARQYASLHEAAIGDYAELIREHGIDCDFARVPAYLYTETSADALRREAEVAAELGIAARFTLDTELPFPIAGAVRFDRQARFHPLKFLRALSRDLEVYEETPVLTVEGGLLRTPRGAVRADHVVFATHFPFINVPGWYFARMHQERSYVLALRCGWLPEGIYYGVDSAGLSFRRTEGLLLLGGEGHRTGENSAGGRYQALWNRAQGLLPGCREAARWSAQDCMPPDGLAYIGPYAASTPNWHVATGFAKWGMTGAMVAAKCIAGEIVGDAPEGADLFSPGRFHASASAKNLAADAAQNVKGLVLKPLSVPERALEALQRDRGGIVDVDGRKAGVYRDEAGNCHIVDPRCPHMGCQLEWNPDERSWDCPCHGSRFDRDGRLIDNPAQRNLDGPAAQ